MRITNFDPLRSEYHSTAPPSGVKKIDGSIGVKTTSQGNQQMKEDSYDRTYKEVSSEAEKNAYFFDVEEEETS